MTAVANDEQTVASMIAELAAEDEQKAAQRQAEEQQEQQESAATFAASLRNHLGGDLYDALGVEVVPSNYSPYAGFTYRGHDFTISWVNSFNYACYTFRGPFGLREENAGRGYDLRQYLLRFLARVPEAEEREKQHPTPLAQTEDAPLEPTPEYMSAEDMLHDEGREMHVFIGQRDADGELDRFSGAVVEATATWLLVRNRTGGQRLIPVANVAYIAPGTKPAK
jgi:hypothetical protein